MSAPQVAALMTTYNSAQYVRETIDSVLSQSFKNFEFVILDDGSTDNTVDIIKSYQDPRIRLFSRSYNKGIGYSLQEALGYVTAPYIVKIDSDDISHPERFKTQLLYLLNNPEISLVKCYFEYFFDLNDNINSERYNARLRDATLINSINTEKLIAEHIPRWLCIEHTTYFAKTDIIRAIGYPDQRLCEDYALFYRMHDNGYRIGCLPEVLVKMRISNTSVTAALDAEKLRLWFGYLLAFKLNRVKKLAGTDRQLAIYGSGQLAQLMYSLLSDAGFYISCFIEQQESAAIEVENKKVRVCAISDCLHEKIIIAAQPARLKVLNQLITAGLTEWNDFMVIA